MTSTALSPIPPLDRRDRRLALLACLAALVVYNANLRLIATDDSIPARFLPFALWAHGTVYLDPVLDATIQRSPKPYWMIQRTVNGHKASLFPIVTPVLVAPVYLPAVLYLEATGWNQGDLERVGLVMEKLAASLVTSLAVGLMYLVLRRRLGVRDALLLTAAFAFGTGTWSTSSQALWLHAVAELMAVAALWFLTGEPTRGRALQAGAAVALLVANRPPDLFIALGLAAYAPFWAGRKTPFFVLGGLVPGLLVLAYNLISFHHPLGAWSVLMGGPLFQHPVLLGIAALLFSPGRGLFVFSPFLLFLPWGIARSLRDRPARLPTLFLAGGVLLHLWLYGRTDWRAGHCYGPRYLLDTLPILIWLLAPVLPALGRVARAAFLALCLFAAGVELVGAFLYLGTSNLILYRNPYDMRSFWLPQNAPFLIEARNDRPRSNILLALQHLGEPLPPPPPRLEFREPIPPSQSPRAGQLSDFYTIVPCRITDTRSGAPLAQTRTFQIAGAGCGIPASAVAVAGNVTILGATGRGVIGLQADSTRGALAMPFAEARSRSTHAILPLAPDGSVTAVIQGPGSLHLALDVSGYFLPEEGLRAAAPRR